MNAISAAMAEIHSGVSHRALRCNDPRNLSNHMIKLGDACIAGQYLRELTMNCIQAILRIPEDKRGKRRILIDAAHEILDDGLMTAASIERTAPRLAFLDQGCGMDGHAMVRHIGGIFDSADGASNNHGIGARIATFKSNPHGVTFLSWIDAGSDGAMVRMEANAAGELSLRILRPDAGEEDDRAWAPIPAALCPEEIRAAGSGTVVVLHGAHEKDDTTRHPEIDLPGGGYAVVRYLGSRFAELPEWITITVQRRWTDVRGRVGNAKPIGGERQTEGGTRLNVVPAMEGLRRICSRYEAVQIHGAHAHVFLMAEDYKTVHEGDARILPQGGTTAVLHDGELYEFPRDADELSKRMGRFGVPLAQDQVVVVVEPKAARTSRKGPPCSSDITRGRLQWHPDGNTGAPSPDLPWNRWCVDFIARMPGFLRDHINDAVAKRTREGGDSFDLESLLKANERALTPMRVRIDSTGAESCGGDGADVLAPAGRADVQGGGCDAAAGEGAGAGGAGGGEPTGGKGSGGAGNGSGRQAPMAGAGAGTGAGPAAWSEGSAAPTGQDGERSEGRGDVAAAKKAGPKQRIPQLLFAKADDPRTVDVGRYDIDSNTLVLDPLHNTMAGARAKEHRPGRTPEILPAVDKTVDQVVGSLICLALVSLINDRRRSRDEITAATSPAALTAIAAAVVVGGSDKIREHCKKHFGSGEIGKGRPSVRR